MTIIVADSYDKVTMNVVSIVLNQGEYAQNHIFKYMSPPHFRLKVMMVCYKILQY